MAIFHLTAKVVSRGRGQSAVAKAAYNSRSKIEQERTGIVNDYSRKDGLEFSGIFAPKDAPEWARDRAQLWNEVEKAEKRKDAQLAREIEVALPHELNAEQRRQLMTDFVREQFQRKGMVADVNIHAPDRKGDDRNYHAHILVTMREIGPEGFGPKVREWNSREQLEKWREGWERTANRYLERHGFEPTLDRRTLEAQGIDREPTKHRGVNVQGMERRGLDTERGNAYRDTVERNTELQNLRAELREVEQALSRDAGPRFAERGEDLRGTAARIWEARQQSDNAPQFLHELAERGLRVAVVDAFDRATSERTGDARHELAEMIGMKAKGVWLVSHGGIENLTAKQKDSAERSYDGYKHINHERPKMDFGEYVSFIQERQAGRFEHLKSDAAALNKAGVPLPAVELQQQTVRAREGTFVVLNERGHLYYLNERTTGVEAAGMQQFMAGVDPATFRSVAETRDEIERDRARSTGPERGGMAAVQAWGLREVKERYEEQQRQQRERQREEQRLNPALKSGAEEKIDVARFRSDPEYRREVRERTTAQLREERARSADRPRELERDDRQR